jgi:UDP:flavonoid glycosyltransferase YjiC (YdhE family)
MGQTFRVVAIAKALQRRGHDIRFIASGKMVSVIKSFGLQVIEVQDMPQLEIYTDLEARAKLPREELMAQMQALMMGIARMETEVAKRERPDLIVSGTLTGPQAAKQLGIPSFLAFLQPHGLKTLQMVESRIGPQSDQEIAAHKQKLLEMVAGVELVFLEGMPEISGGAALNKLGPEFAGLKEKIRFTGPLLTENPDQLPDRQVLKQKHIGDSSRPLAYITIGGGSMLIGERFLQLVLEALRLVPEVTGVIATGIAISPQAIHSFAPPANAVILGFAPGTELIKASDVTIFHGGSSTLMTCIACGTPAVVIPSMGEQEDNGAVLAEHGAGIVLDKASLTPAILAEAIQQVLGSAGYRQCAQRLKELGQQYGGAQTAADWIEKSVGVLR